MEYCREMEPFGTPRQVECLLAVLEYGNQRDAAAALGTSQSNLNQHLRLLKTKAARAGIAPGHFKDGVPEGYKMGKVTVQRGPNGVERTWERMSPDQNRTFEALQAILDEAATDLPRRAPISFTGHVRADLLTHYTFTDYHLGMRAHQEEGGDDWNLAIAEELLTRAFAALIEASPPAKVGLICQLGDFLHFDGLLPVTPTNRHVLDADSHFQLMVRAGLRCLRRLVEMALQKHEKVVVLNAEGNHDMATSIWLRETLKIIYENEPRVEVLDSLTPYYVYQWGATMLGFHHGHTKRTEALPQYFAAQHSKMWGDTRHRYGHSGHFHHEVVTAKHPGMVWIQHPSLTANDSHSARGAYLSPREAKAFVYSNRFGKVSEFGVTPEMVQDAAPLPLAA